MYSTQHLEWLVPFYFHWTFTVASMEPNWWVQLDKSAQQQETNHFYLCIVFVTKSCTIPVTSTQKGRNADNPDERSDSVVECWTRGRWFEPLQRYCVVFILLNTGSPKEISQHDWKNVDGDVKQQHRQTHPLHPHWLISAFVTHSQAFDIYHTAECKRLRRACRYMHYRQSLRFLHAQSMVWTKT